MKNRFRIILLALIVIILASACSSSEEAEKENIVIEKSTLFVNYSFAGIENGYDHEAKMLLMLDGNILAETNPHLLSQPQNASFSLPIGKHKIKTSILVNYNGVWEECLKANDYSIDAFYETETDFNSDQTLKILFDLDKGTIREYN